MERRGGRWLGLVCLACMGVVAGWPAAAQEPNNPSTATQPAQPAATLAEGEWEMALDAIQKRFLRPVDRAELERRALELLLKDLDPYSDYLSPDELAAFQERNDGGFVGIGVQLENDPARNVPRIARLFAGSAAAVGGLRRGDRLLAVGDRPLAGLGFGEVRDLLVGEPGTPVALRLLRAEGDREEQVTLLRRRVETPSVRGLRQRADGSHDYLFDTSRHLGYVRVVRLGRDTVPAFQRALDALRLQQARGLVIDLRDCSGGMMTAALGVADELIDQGRLLTVVERGKETGYDAHAGTRWQGPLVVLINEGTVSSGEILAGALKDSGRAALVGSRTFGKGRVQVLFRLGDGHGGLMLSNGTFQRPNGQTVDRHDVAKDSGLAGIPPDAGLEVSVSKAERDALRRLQDVLDSNAVVDDLELASRPRDRELERAQAWLLAQPPAATLR